MDKEDYFSTDTRKIEIVSENHPILKVKSQSTTFWMYF